MKQIIQKIWMVIALLCASVSASAYDFEVNGIYYTVTSLQDLTCEVSTAPDENGDTGRSHYTGEIVIPSTVEFKGRTLSVNRIGEEAFTISDVTSVSLPNTVIEIGDRAFEWCRTLTSIKLPEFLTIIGERAFRMCDRLPSISLPNSLTYIGKSAFDLCESLTSISLPNSLTYIGANAFGDCESLTSISLPQSLASINNYTFSACSSLTSILLPNSLTYIGVGAFEDCSSLTSISLPESLESIDKFAFSGCKSLKSVKLPESLTFLSCAVFRNNSSLTEINIPANIKTIITSADNGDSMFEGCEKLYKIRIEADYNDPELFRHTNISDLYLEYNFNWIGPVLGWLQKLELGGNLQVLSSNENSNHSPSKVLMPESLTEIICHSLVPPTIKGYYFSNSHYLNTVVKVPTESLEAYKNAEPWKNFWEIQGCEDVGVETVEVAENPIEVARYDLYGRCVSADYEGIVIIRYSDGSSKKIINRNI